MLNEDYKEMLQILLDNEVKFLVVGAYTMGTHGYPRATGDIDIITQVSGLEFNEVHQQQEVVDVEGLAPPFLCRSDLIKNKRATGREKDRLDADRMEYKTQ